MDYLLNYYKINIEEADEFEAFKKFYVGNITPIEEWYEKKCAESYYAKNNEKSQEFRAEGNKYFKKSMWKQCVKYYTKAVNFAESESKEYALALANRSAALFCLEDYENCIKDIDHCIHAKYPKDLCYKVYIRKAECENRLGILSKEFLQTVEKCIHSSGLSVMDKEKHFTKLKCMKVTNTQPDEKIIELGNNTLNFKENPNFAFASDAITLCYDKMRGRTVVAKKDISQGDMLFLEEAFLFAPVFDDRKQLVPNKCYNCLKDMMTSIPCKTCAMCQYCDKECRDTSWEEFHRWECKGMTYNLFYDLGIAFPALRSLIKGVNSKFPIPKDGDQSNIETFGCKDDNYPYFNTLLTNLNGNENYIHFLIISTVIILYLKKHTDFFVYSREKVGINSIYETIMKCGGLLVRHMAQLGCNSSVVDHWNVTLGEIPTQATIVACAIYPSVSMMNHSCKPNITIYYNKDVAVVKALRDIQEGEEICNCYGVDYRYMKFDERQRYLKKLYNFVCRCEICSNPLLEYDIDDSYLCPNCEGPVCTTIGNCYYCKKYFKLDMQRQIESEVDSFFEQEHLTKEDIDKCYAMCTEIFSKYHLKIADCLDLYCSLFRTEGNLIEMMSYFKKMLHIKNARYGPNSKHLVLHQINTIEPVIQKLKLKNKNIDDEKLLEEAITMYNRAFEVLKLYYADDILKLSRPTFQ